MKNTDLVATTWMLPLEVPSENRFAVRARASSSHVFLLKAYREWPRDKRRTHHRIPCALPISTASESLPSCSFVHISSQRIHLVGDVGGAMDQPKLFCHCGVSRHHRPSSGARRRVHVPEQGPAAVPRLNIVTGLCEKDLAVDYPQMINQCNPMMYDIDIRFHYRSSYRYLLLTVVAKPWCLLQVE